MLTEPTFCRNSSINISIDNRYYNLFIHLGRPIFTVNHNGASVVKIPDDTWDRPCACYTREAPVTQFATMGVGSSQLNSSNLLLFRQPLTSPIIVFTSGPTCLLVQTQLQSIWWPWKTIFFSASAPSNPPFLPVDCCDWRWLRNDFSIPCAPENMSHKNIITIRFHIWM